jgi:hypothetical protein
MTCFATKRKSRSLKLHVGCQLKSASGTVVEMIGRIAAGNSVCSLSRREPYGYKWAQTRIIIGPLCRIGRQHQNKRAGMFFPKSLPDGRHGFECGGLPH